MAEPFLKENGLTWNDSKISVDEILKNKILNSNNLTQKLNILSIAADLNLPKIYVQNGLSNIFKSIGYILGSNLDCVIELSHLGNIYTKNKLTYHIPTQIKKESFFVKKATVKSLLGKTKEQRVVINRDNFDKEAIRIIITFNIYLEMGTTDKFQKTLYDKMRLSIKTREKENKQIFEVQNMNIQKHTSSQVASLKK